MAQTLVARGIAKSYGSIPVLKGVSIAVDNDEIHAVIGPNGAGKTTLFKVLSGELLADEGSVEFDGHDVSRLDGYERVRIGIGRTFQVARVFAELTALQNVIIAIEAREWSWRATLRLGRGIASSPAVVEEAAALLEQMSIDVDPRTAAGILAYGNRKRLELAMALAMKPRLVMLDEPMAGMSPGDRSAAVELIRKINRDFGLAVLFSEHDMGVVFALAQRITVMSYGEIIASGTPAEVKNSPLVRQVYLGQEDEHA